MATVNKGETLIEVKGLKKHFGKLQVLRGIDEQIHAGEVVVIIGPSGSGKSTFLRCLNLLETPTGGDVIFEGESVMKAGNDCLKDPQNYAARANMMWASSLAHNGLTQCGREVQLVVHQLSAHQCPLRSKIVIFV